MSDKITLKWRDVYMPVEAKGLASITLPTDEYFSSQPGDAVSGNLTDPEFAFSFAGAGAVTVRGKGKNPKPSTKVVTDESGKITWARNSGDGWIRFRGVTSSFRMGSTQLHNEVNGWAYVPDDGPGQVHMDIDYGDKDARGMVKISGPVEVDAVGEVDAGGNQGN